MAEIRAGDEVEVRSASGEWKRTTACSGPRWDHKNGFVPRGQRNRQAPFKSIAVVWPNHPDGAVVNWPVEDVRPVEGVEPPASPPT